MIRGIGIDAVEIERFGLWHTYSSARLQKIFSAEEIAYCLSTPRKTTERFAVRFAAKEAFFKALSAAGGSGFGLLKICATVSVVSNDERPELLVDWAALKRTPLKAHFSLSHTRVSAVAIVALEDQQPATPAQ